MKPPAELFQRSEPNSTWQILRLWICVAALIGLQIAAHSLWVDALVFILIGTFQYHMNVLGHDGLHGSLFRRRRWNDFASRFFLHGPSFSPFSILKKNHFHHHRFVGADHDHDRQYYANEGKDTVWRLQFWLLKSLVGGMFFPILIKLLRRPKGSTTAPTIDRELVWDGASLVLSQALILAVFWASGHPWSYFIFWVLPFITVATGLNSIRSCLEHIDLEAVTTAHAYSFRPGRVEAFFLSPYRMCYHWEHHLYPSVPYTRLVELSRFLKSEETLNVHPSYFKKLSRWKKTERDRILKSH